MFFRLRLQHYKYYWYVRLLSYIAVFSFGAAHCFAAPYATISSGSGDWESSGSWTNGPEAGALSSGTITTNSYVITAGGTINRTGDILENGPNLDIYGTLNISNDFTNQTGGFRIRSGGVLRVYGNCYAKTNFTVDDGGLLIVYGDFDMNHGGVNINGNVVVGGNVFREVSPGFNISSTGNLVVGGGLTVNNHLSGSSSTNVYLYDPNQIGLSDAAWDALSYGTNYGNSVDLYANEATNTQLLDAVNEVILGGGLGITITSQPGNAYSCISGNTTFSVVATGVVSYQWQVNTSPTNSITFTNVSNGTNYSGSATTNLTVIDPPTSFSGYQYRCKLTNSSGRSMYCSAVMLTVGNGSAPTISAQPSDVSVCSSGSASFSVTASGGTLSYQWQRSTDGGTNYFSISSATSSSYNTGAVSGSMSGYKYHCVVGLSGGCYTTSNGATLTVGTPVAAGSFTTYPTAVCGGNSATFIVAAITGVTGYSWTYNFGTATTTSTAANSLTISFSNVSASSTIAVAGTNTCGTGSALTGSTVNVFKTPSVGTITHN